MTFNGTYMSVYELDEPTPDDFIQTLYFNPTKTISGCTFDDCPQQSSSWFNVVSRQPVSPIILDAQVRFNVLSCTTVEGQCP